jgi:hypothetical protein
MSGFFPGVLWQLYELGGRSEPAWAERARTWQAGLAGRQRDFGAQHDFGEGPEAWGRGGAWGVAPTADPSRQTGSGPTPAAATTQARSHATAPRCRCPHPCPPRPQASSTFRASPTVTPSPTAQRTCGRRWRRQRWGGPGVSLGLPGFPCWCLWGQMGFGDWSRRSLQVCTALDDNKAVHTCTHVTDTQPHHAPARVHSRPTPTPIPAPAPRPNPGRPCPGRLCPAAPASAPSTAGARRSLQSFSSRL